MLLCVCLSVCILCVNECVFLRSLCQCVCSSNTGFSPHYPPHLLPSSSLLTFDGYTPTSSQFQTKFSLFIHYFFHVLKTSPHYHLSCSFLLTTSSISPFIDPSIHSLPLVSSKFPSSPPLLFSFTSHLWSFALPFLFLPHPVHFVLLLPSSLPLSLSHSALCLALSGWAAPRWLRVCVHSGACRASPPPGLTTRFCLSPLNSAAPPPLPPFHPCHILTLHFTSPTPQNFSCHLGADSTHSPPQPPTASPSVVLSSLLDAYYSQILLWPVLRLTQHRTVIVIIIIIIVSRSLNTKLCDLFCYVN